MHNPYRRTLILHADDYGMNPAVTQGILRGFTHGLLTSTSVLANAPDCGSALRAWRDLLELQRVGGLPSQDARRRLEDSELPFDLGLHLNLTQGRPLTADYPMELLDSRGRFPGVFRLFQQLLRNPQRLREGLRKELVEQVSRVRDFGILPSHANGHQYVEMFPVVAELMPPLLERFDITVTRVARERGAMSLRSLGDLAREAMAAIKRRFALKFEQLIDRAQIEHPDRYFGTSHAGRIDFKVLRHFVHSAGYGLTEIGCHPGLLSNYNHTTSHTNDDGWEDPLARLRPLELDLLTSPALTDFLEAQQINLGRLRSLSLAAAEPEAMVA